MLHQEFNDDGVPLRSAYVIHDPVNLVCPPEEGLTRQEFRDECDINVLMAQYEKTGELPLNLRGTGEYLDVTDVPDLQRYHQIMQDAEVAFMRLPASVRRDFDNDPMKFVAFAEDATNLDKMREWGLAPPAAPVPPGPTLQESKDAQAAQPAVEK